MDDCKQYYVLVLEDGVYSLVGGFDTQDEMDEWQDADIDAGNGGGWGLSPLEIEMLKR